MANSFSRSPVIIFETGIPVARDTTSAISSAPTCVLSNCSLRAESLPVESAAFRRASSSGILPY